MSTLSDEAAGAAAARAGDRLKTAPGGCRIYALEPATGRWCITPEIYYLEPRPTCTVCREGALWAGRPRHRSGVWLYPVRCGCGFAVLESPWRLTMAGTWHWWRTGAAGVASEWSRDYVRVFLDDYRTESWARRLRLETERAGA